MQYWGAHLKITWQYITKHEENETNIKSVKQIIVYV